MSAQLYFANNDGLVSQNGSNPIYVTLLADQNEEKEFRLYVQTDSGYTVGNLEIVPVGATANKWALAPDNAGAVGTYEADGSPLPIGDLDGRVYFWAKAKATDDENPVMDTSVSLDLMGVSSMPQPWWDEGGFSNSLTSITISWAAVINATSYEVRINAGAPIVVSSGTTYTFENLEPETQYEVDIIASNGTVYSQRNSITVQTDSFDEVKGSQSNQFTTE